MRLPRHGWRQVKTGKFMLYVEAECCVPRNHSKELWPWQSQESLNPDSRKQTGPLLISTIIVPYEASLNQKILSPLIVLGAPYWTLHASISSLFKLIQHAACCWLPPTLPTGSSQGWLYLLDSRTKVLEKVYPVMSADFQRCVAWIQKHELMCTLQRINC